MRTSPVGGCGFRVQAEPVIGPAKGRTRWPAPE